MPVHTANASCPHGKCILSSRQMHPVHRAFYFWPKSGWRRPWKLVRLWCERLAFAGCTNFLPLCFLPPPGPSKKCVPGVPEGLTPLVEWEWWSNFMPWLILVQVKGAMDHPVYQVVVSVRLKVPWASHGRQFTKNSVTPPLLLHQSCLTLAPPQKTPLRRPRGCGRISVFHRFSFVMETTKTTFKNNLVLRAHLEHSHFQNRYSLWIGKWARAS